MSAPVPACQCRATMAKHPLIELGRCWHAVGGVTHVYVEYACPDCGGIARKHVGRTRGSYVPPAEPTTDNCLALRWEAAPWTDVTTTRIVTLIRIALAARRLLDDVVDHEPVKGAALQASLPVYERCADLIDLLAKFDHPQSKGTPS